MTTEKQPRPPCRVQVDDLESAEYARLLDVHDRYAPRWLTPTIQVGPLLLQDKEELLRYMNDPRIYSFLVGPPNPYRPEDADWWIHHRATRMLEDGTPLHFAIRDMDNGGKLIGSVTVDSTSDDDLDGDNVGYWLAPEYHGQGLMARAVNLLIQDIAIGKVGKRKFNSFVFEGNWASRRTLEKAGMAHCPEMGREAIKDGVAIPCWRMRMFLSEQDVSKRERVEWATPAPHLIPSHARIE